MVRIFPLLPRLKLPKALRMPPTVCTGPEGPCGAFRGSKVIFEGPNSSWKLCIGRVKAPIRYWLLGLPTGAGAVSSLTDSDPLLYFLRRFGASKATAGFAGAEIQSASAPVAAKAEEKGVRLERLLSQQGKSLRKSVFMSNLKINAEIH